MFVDTFKYPFSRLRFMKGKLIVIYGINNLGKSTQAKMLVAALKEKGYAAEYLKYPLYQMEPFGPMINDYLRNNNPQNLSAREFQMVQLLNKLQFQEELKEKLDEGMIVIAEDYRGTSLAWGIGAGVDEQFLKKTNAVLLDEDLVFLFDGERFLRSVEKNHKHE